MIGMQKAQSTRMRAVKYFWDMSCTHSHILLMLDAIMHVYQAGKNVKLPHLQPLHGRRQRQEASRLKDCLPSGQSPPLRPSCRGMGS